MKYWHVTIWMNLENIMLSVWLSLGCCNKLSLVGWFKTVELFLFQVSRPEVQNQGVGKTGSSWTLWMRIHTMPLSYLLVAAMNSRCFLACRDITWISASIYVSSLLFFYKDSCHCGLRAHPNSGWSHLELLNIIAYATLFPLKCHISRLCIHLSFGGPPFNPLY